MWNYMLMINQEKWLTFKFRKLIAKKKQVISSSFDEQILIDE